MAEVKRFQHYYDDYTPGPKYWPNTHLNGEEGTAPQRDIDENLELALHVKRGGHFTWQEVWTMPLGMLRWNSTALAKLDGAKIDIWTPEHEEMFAAHKIRREAGIDERGKAIAAEKGLPFDEARKQAHEEYWAKIKTTYGHAAQQSKQ